MELIEGMLWLVEDTQELLCPTFQEFLVQIRARGLCSLQPTFPSPCMREDFGSP